MFGTMDHRSHSRDPPHLSALLPGARVPGGAVACPERSLAVHDRAQRGEAVLALPFKELGRTRRERGYAEVAKLILHLFASHWCADTPSTPLNVIRTLLEVAKQSWKVLVQDSSLRLWSDCPMIFEILVWRWENARPCRIKCKRCKSVLG